MSNAPYILKEARFGYRLGDGAVHRPDASTTVGVSSFDGKHMVEQASFVSRELGITRESRTPGRSAPTSAPSPPATRGASQTSSSR